jgi:hypothetical protein
MFKTLTRAPVFLALMLMGATLPSTARAQQSAGVDADDAVSAAVADTDDAGLTAASVMAPAADWPNAAPADFLVWAPPASPFDAAPPQDRVRAGPNIAMMAVGGAALVVGLVIGGDGGLIIATTGGVIGLIGLYRYLR